MGIDRPRQRDPINRKLLLIDLESRESGDQQPDDSHQSNDEAKTDHALTRKKQRAEKPIAADK
jgi:hypothetical protein